MMILFSLYSPLKSKPFLITPCDGKLQCHMYLEGEMRSLSPLITVGGHTFRSAGQTWWRWEPCQIRYWSCSVYSCVCSGVCVCVCVTAGCVRVYHFLCLFLRVWSMFWSPSVPVSTVFVPFDQLTCEPDGFRRPLPIWWFTGGFPTCVFMLGCLSRWTLIGLYGLVQRVEVTCWICSRLRCSSAGH